MTKANKPLLLLAAAALLYCWALGRIPRLAEYQTPPRPVMHSNYYTFHDMSEQWDGGTLTHRWTVQSTDLVQWVREVR